MAKKKTATRKSGKRRRRVNKRAAILNYLADHPEAGPKVVSVELRKDRIRVTPAYVSNVKSTTGNGKVKRAGRGRKKAALTASPVEDMKHARELMLQAVDLVVRAGVKEAQNLVDLAGRMVERVGQSGGSKN